MMGLWILESTSIRQCSESTSVCGGSEQLWFILKRLLLPFIPWPATFVQTWNGGQVSLEHTTFDSVDSVTSLWTSRLTQNLVSGCLKGLYFCLIFVKHRQNRFKIDCILDAALGKLQLLSFWCFKWLFDQWFGVIKISEILLYSVRTVQLKVEKLSMYVLHHVSQKFLQ